MIQDGITPLMYASKTGKLEVVKIQLQKFAKIDVEEKVNIFLICVCFSWSYID